MNTIISTILETRPCLSWKFASLRIAAGTTWVTFSGRGEPVRIRGAAALATLLDGLERLQNLDGKTNASFELGPGLVARHEVDTGHSRLRLHDEPWLDLQSHRVYDILRDVWEWFSFLNGTRALPFGTDYQGAAFNGRTLVIMRPDRGNFRLDLDRPENLRQQILKLLADEEWRDYPAMHPGRGRVEMGDGGDGRHALCAGKKTLKLSNTALIHIAATLGC